MKGWCRKLLIEIHQLLMRAKSALRRECSSPVIRDSWLFKATHDCKTMTTQADYRWWWGCGGWWCWWFPAEKQTSHQQSTVRGRLFPCCMKRRLIFIFCPKLDAARKILYRSPLRPQLNQWVEERQFWEQQRLRRAVSTDSGYTWSTRSATHQH